MKKKSQMLSMYIYHIMEFDYCCEEGNIFEYHNRLCISKGAGRIMDEHRNIHKIDSRLQNDLEFVNINVPEKKQVEFILNLITEHDVWFINNVISSFVTKYKDSYASEVKLLLQNIATRKMKQIKGYQVSNLVNEEEPLDITKAKNIYKDCNYDTLINIIRVLYLV